MASLPLVDRPDGAALFLRAGAAIGPIRFLADAQALAAALPQGSHLINLCRDRYWFTVALGASLIARRVCLLPPDPSLGALAALADRYPGAIAVADEDRPAPCPLLIPSAHEGDSGTPIAIPADQLAAIAFTSGSTGAPVAHPKTWGALVARSRAAAARFGLDEHRPVAIVGTVPPGHMYGFETTALLPLHAACASWCGAPFFPADVAAALRDVPAPAMLVTTPLQLRALQDLAPKNLSAVISATAPLDPAVAAAVEASWGAPVMEVFGATECGSIASRRTTAGEPWQPYRGVTLREVGAAVTAEAFGMPPVTLGDALALAADGSFLLLGRRTDMVKLGGRRASLEGLNRILTSLDGVVDGAFIVPDDLERRTTARLLAVVVAPARSAPSLLAELRLLIDPVFLPRRVVHVRELPRNALGKLPRQALLDLVPPVPTGAA